MQLENILKDEKNSILLFIPGDNKKIVIGVPHHAPQGVLVLPCEEHPVSDENAGFVGAALAGLLNCPAIIACNYFMDVNKHKSSDYYKKIQSLQPKILVEIHGHSRNKAHFDIEISSGSLEKNIWSQGLAGRLSETLMSEPLLQSYTVSGDFREIYFKATRSTSITSPAWIAFHIELPRSIRASRDQYLLFCDLLVEALREILTDLDHLERLKAKAT
jgi:hypothetical protein